jgi:signal transduction histidine kinase
MWRVMTAAGLVRARRGGGLSPVTGLGIGLLVAVLLIVGFSLYTAREIATLRDEQAAISERNRLDALQIVRIQQNLSSIAGALRDMLAGTEPYPLVAWSNTFARLRADLEQALAREKDLAPVGRSPAEQAQLDEANRRLWEALGRAFTTAQGGDEAAAAELVRGEASIRHAELVTLVSQLLIRNTRIDEEASSRARAIYDRVAREIFILAGVLITGVVVGGALLIGATRRTFQAVASLAAERRALSWRMLRMQEDLQTEFARELHDEFGQILTAVGMMLGRLRKRAERALEAGQPGADETTVRDLAEIQDIAQRTLERIRTKSRMLHPVILDDFGLQQAVAWYVGEFSRQHGIQTTFVPSGSLAGLPPDVSTHLYRIVQESLTNVSRHASASRATVRLSQTDGHLELAIEDDGKGLPGVAGPRGLPVPAGIGMTGMRERAELMGGSFRLGTAALGGLGVTVTVPLEAGSAPSS